MVVNTNKCDQCVYHKLCRYAEAYIRLKESLAEVNLLGHTTIPDNIVQDALSISAFCKYYSPEGGSSFYPNHPIDASRFESPSTAMQRLVDMNPQFLMQNESFREDRGL